MRPSSKFLLARRAIRSNSSNGPLQPKPVDMLAGSTADKTYGPSMSRAFGRRDFALVRDRSQPGSAFDFIDGTRS